MFWAIENTPHLPGLKQIKIDMFKAIENTPSLREHPFNLKGGGAMVFFVVNFFPRFVSAAEIVATLFF